MLPVTCGNPNVGDVLGRPCGRPAGHDGLAHHFEPFEHDKDTRRVRFNSTAIEDMAMNWVMYTCQEMKTIKSSDRGMIVYVWFKGDKWYETGGKSTDQLSVYGNDKWSRLADAMSKHHIYPF